MSPAGPQTKVTVEVDGRQLQVTNLEKVLYPEVGFTKGQVIEYYTRIAPALLPHIESRPMTFKRYPEGVDGEVFFQKNAPSHAPEWVRRAPLPTPGSTKQRDTTTFAIICDLPSLVWSANLAALELHVPMWQVDAKNQAQNPDLLVYDLDPGPPADIVKCCDVALHVRAALDEDGLTAFPKTSGSKGLQLYVPLVPERKWQDVHAYARRAAERLENDHPKLVVSNMKKELRKGKVLVDWSQNNQHKTTVCVYSLRAKPTPTASTPVTWDEVAKCLKKEDP